VCCPAHCSTPERPYNCSAAGQQQYCLDHSDECIPLAMQCNPATYAAPPYSWLPAGYSSNPYCTNATQTTCLIPM
jgi:hypothetical protein